MKNTPVHYTEGENPIVTPVPHDAIQIGQEETYLADLPNLVREVVKLDEPDVKRDVLTANDTGAKVIAGIGEKNGNHQLSTNMPRFFFDVNRDPDKHVDGHSVEGRPMEPTSPHGSIWRATVPRMQDQSDITDALVRPYTPEEFERLRTMAFKPWVEAYRKAMDTAVKQHGFAIAAEVHTFPSNVPGRIQKPGKYQNGYAIGPKMRMGRVNGMEDLMSGKMPGVFAITNYNHAEGKPGSCHPMVLSIVEQEFEHAGYPVTNGFGPLQGEYGSTVMYGDPANNRHVVGLEIIDHNITPNKINGSVEYNEEEVQRLAEVMRKIYSRFALLRVEDFAV